MTHKVKLKILLSYGGGAKYGGGAIPFVILISPKSPPINGFTGGKAPVTGGSVICGTACTTGVVEGCTPAGGTIALVGDGAGASPLGPGDWSIGTGSIVSLLPLGLSGLEYGGGGSVEF